jgi:WD40 repeat protein/serine/threonine protein kinase
MDNPRTTDNGPPTADNGPPTTDHPNALPPGLLKPPRVPDHELVRRIGRGAYGEVWLARSVTGAYRAVKIVHRGSFDHDRPFEREFSGILRFEPISRNHDSQVDILHVGRADDCFYYVMELADDQVNGQQIDPERYTPKTIKSEVFQRGKLPFEECVQISLALTTALENLHGNGLVHRDVKPSNIIFVNGVPKLADIGLVTGVEATRSFVGTEGFAPPEGPGTPQADIYSLGKVLYEISTGKDRQEFPELPTTLDQLPDREALLELNAVIAKACREDPRARYQTAKAMHDDLMLLQSGKSLARLHRMERTVAKLKRVSLAIAVVTVLATGAWLYQSHQTRQLKKLAADNLGLAKQAQANAAESRRNELSARQNLYATDISQSQHALAADNLRQAVALLQKYTPKAGEPDLRGFEWRYLWQQCQSDELFSLPGHEQTASCTAFSPNGHLLATGSWDGTVKIWEVPARRLLATLSGVHDFVRGVSFSPGGDVLAVASLSGVRLWNARTGQPLRSLNQCANKARFSPDGQWFATGGTNLVLWATGTWQPVKTLELAEFANDGNEFALAFSPDSRWIYIVLEDGVRVLGVPGLQEEAVMKDPMPSRRFVALSPDGRTLATCTMGHEVKLWDSQTRKPLRSLRGHGDTLGKAAFSPDGNRLATCSADQTVKLWDVPTGALLRTFRGHAEEVWDIAFSPDGKLLASVSKDGAVKVWNPVAESQRDRDLSQFWPIGFAADGNLAGFLKDDRLTVVDPDTHQRISVSSFRGRGGSTPFWFASPISPLMELPWACRCWKRPNWKFGICSAASSFAPWRTGRAAFSLRPSDSCLRRPPAMRRSQSGSCRRRFGDASLPTPASRWHSHRTKARWSRVQRHLQRSKSGE